MIGLRLLLLLLLAWNCIGCETLGFLTQAAGGHLSVLSKREPIDSLFENPKTPPELKQKLQLAQEVLEFAETNLGLAQGKNYRHYVELPERYVVWNVFIAEPFSVELTKSCFPFAGCVPYRGYFNKKKALAYAKKKQKLGFDTYVSGVSAYSTLGWFADPLISSFFWSGDNRLAGLLFHELAHGLIYLPGDSSFNESYATVIEHRGVCLWLKKQGREKEFFDWYQQHLHRLKLGRFIAHWKGRLAEHYSNEKGLSLATKQEMFVELRADYHRKNWPDNRYDGLIAKLNNASLGTLLTYLELVKPLNHLLARHNHQLPNFYESIRVLTRLTPEKRKAELASFAHSSRNQDHADQGDDCRANQIKH